MHTLGFLKKKRTKDSQGSNSDYSNTPTSPVAHDSKAGSALTPTFSKTSTLFSEPDSTDSTSVPPTQTKPADTSMNAGGQLQGVNANANTQNVPSIHNLIHQPDYGNSGAAPSQHDSAYSSDANNVPTINAPVSKAAANPVRETRGKYTLTDFSMSRTLGTGSFGRVHLVQSKHNQRYYAVKVLKKQQVVKMKQVEHTNDERRMLQRCRHPFLITLWGTWQDSRNLYMVMDFIEGGELFSLLRKSQVSIAHHSIYHSR